MVTTKTTTKKAATKEPKVAKVAAAKSTERYFEAIGRRKTASARVRITPTSKESITVNDKVLADYFQTENMQMKVTEAKKASGIDQNFLITVLL